MATKINTQDIEAAAVTGNELAATITGTKTFSGQLIGKGTATNDSAAAGNVGEYVSSVVSSGSSVSPNSVTWTNITSVSLTAGDWDVSGIVAINNTGTATYANAAVSLYSGTTTTDHIDGDNVAQSNSAVSNAEASRVIPSYRVSIASTTSVYLKTYVNFTTGEATAWGRISARRVR
jgi:hypothetical protein